MNIVDKFICEIDKGLKFSMDNYQKQSRDYPAKDLPEDNLNETERSHSASLMSCLLYTSDAADEV